MSPPKTSSWHPIGCLFKAGPESVCVAGGSDLLKTSFRVCSCRPRDLLVPYHLAHLIINNAILTFIGWDTISCFLLYVLCSLLPRKPCPLSSSTFLSPNDCLVTSYFFFRTSSNVSFCRTLSLRLLTLPGWKYLSFFYFCILFTLYIASDCLICLYSLFHS